jgi:hypothetical protein
MIFHELCHALIEGDAGANKPDWGLDNTRMGNPWREHACLRLQAYLASTVGLREFFAPTTDFRVSFWDALSEDPFSAPPEAGGRREPSCVAARRAAWRASQPRWAAPLKAALASTAIIAAAVPRFDAENSGQLPSLWTLPGKAPSLHPSGHATFAAYYEEHGCADCAWATSERKGGYRCAHAPNARIPEDESACMRWEAANDLDCLTCGACCREAYDSVEIGNNEPVLARYPEWIDRESKRNKLRRNGDRCIALQGGYTCTEAYICAIYDERPQTCRDFERGSDNCLDARRRVGLSL